LLRDLAEAFWFAVAEELAQRTAFHPFHHDVCAAAFGIGKEFYDRWMVQFLADLLFARRRL